MRKVSAAKLCIYSLAAALIASPAAQAQNQNPVQSLKNIWGAKKTTQQPQPANGQPAPQQAGRPGQLAAEGSVNDSGPFTPPAGTKIDPVVMAPIEQGAGFAVSPHGVHVATMSHAGSRVVIIYDGTSGPKFDQIFLQDGAHGVVFSSDGNHWAYCGAQGQEWVVMRDGQEFLRAAGAANGQVNLNYCHDMHFTTNGKHLYFLSVVDASNVSTPTRFVFDGKASPPGADGDLRNYAFSKDGDHYAYIWTDPASRTGAVWRMIVDGQPSQFPGSAPQWSADSKHLFTKRTVNTPGPRGGNAQEVFLDGKPYMKADDVTLNIPPAGDMVVALIRRSNQPQTQFLVAGGKVVPGSELAGNRIGQVTFSPDGRHFGAVFSNANGMQSAFIDGKKGQDYTRLESPPSVGNASPIVFTADSAHSAYLAYSAQANGQFLVFDGQEMGPVQSTTWAVTSPVGGHLMTAGYGQVTLDGQILKLTSDPRSAQATNLSFSPDGNHYAFVVREHGGLSLNVDGVEQTAFTAALQGPNNNQATRPYVWSPDSKHIAYFCRPNNPAAGDDMYLCLDGKGAHLGSPAAYGNLTFTSDSNHLMWTRGGPQASFRAFADGKPVAEGFLPAVSGFADETWQATPDGGVALLMEDQTTLRRVTITPTSSTSLATLFGGTTTMASGK
jgi:WD40 repeat protein